MVEERYPTKMKIYWGEHVDSAARQEGRTPVKIVIEANSPDVKMTTRMLTKSTNPQTVGQSRKTARRNGIVGSANISLIDQ
jgi:hypothetical protein